MPDNRPTDAPPRYTLRRLLRAILNIGAHADDDDETSIRKILLNLASVLFATAALVWVAVAWVVDDAPDVLPAAGVPALALLNLAVFQRPDHQSPFRLIELAPGVAKEEVRAKTTAHYVE